jgi:hypothetical protein
MPTWRNGLPPEGKNRGFDLIRTPPSASLLAIVTSDDLLVCDTHYWHGRTQPCERQCNAEGRTTDDSTCPPCREKTAWRTHVYLSAYDAKRKNHFIFECTTHAAKPFAEYLQAAGTLRGCLFNACRPKGGANARVAITTTTADLGKLHLPTGPDVPLALSVIWRLPRTALDTVAEHAGENQIRTRATILAQMRDQPDNACDLPTIGEVLRGNGSLRKMTTPH